MKKRDIFLVSVLALLAIYLWMGPLQLGDRAATAQVPYPAERIPRDVGRELFTPAKGWVLMRTTGVVDGATLDAAGYSLTADDISWGTVVVNETTIDATNGMIDVWDELGYGINAVTIAFFVDNDAANDDFDFSLYAWKDSPYGPAIPVFSTTGDACFVGTYDAVKHPTTGVATTAGLWVDIIDGTDHWPAGVTIADSGNNGICTMTFDLMGCRYLHAAVWSADGNGNKAVTIGAIITGH